MTVTVNNPLFFKYISVTTVGTGIDDGGQFY